MTQINDRAQRALPYIVGVALLGLVAVFVVVAFGQAEGSSRRQAAVDALSTDVRTLRQQVESSGQEPAAPDPDERVEDLPDSDSDAAVMPGPVGPRGPAPTAAQISAAVATVLASDPELAEPNIATAVVAYLQANPPPPGQPGRPPTDGEIGVAVAAFCSDGACRGTAGDRGPGPTDEQIATAVATYCDARGECRGVAGQDGAAGAAGRGIVSIICNDDNDWVVTFDQPPTEVIVDGPCRVETVPPPDPPTPTPTPGG
jgi:hypothetical protein